MFLDCGKKPEYPEKIQWDWPGVQLRVEPRTFLLWDKSVTLSKTQFKSCLCPLTAFHNYLQSPGYFCPPHTLHPPCLLISGMEVCILVQQSAFKWPKYLLNSLEARAPGQWCKSAMKRDASSMLRLLSVIHTGMFSPLTPPQRRSRNCDRGSDQ